MDLSEYILEPLHRHEDFVFYRGRHQGDCGAERTSILLMVPMASDPLFPGSVQAHGEFVLNSDRVSAIVRPVAVAQYEGRAVLVLENPGEEHLDELVEKTLSTGRLLKIALEQALKETGRSNTALEQENQALRERVAELQLQVGMLQHLPVSAWTLKPDGTPDFVSEVWLDYSGQTLDFVRSHPEAWMSAVHPDDREFAAKSFWAGVRSGTGFAFETRSLRAQDGTYRWHLQQSVVLRDRDGKVVRFIGTTTDIDDQKRAEEALRASEANLRRVIDTIPTLSWCNLPDGPNEFLSQSWHQYTGLSPEEAQGWGWSAAFHPDDLPPLMKRWQEMLISGEPGEIEARLRRHDGIYRWFLIRAAPFLDEKGAVLRWYGTSIDIEDRKRAEDALLASERNLYLIINTMPVLAWSARPDGSADFFNQRWLDYTGLTQSEARDWGWEDAFHPDDLARVTDHWGAHILSGEPGEIEARIRALDGTYRWFLLRGSPLRDESGEIVKWYGTNTDIDGRKRAEEALRASERNFRQTVNRIPGLVCTMNAAGEIEQLNQPLLEYFGMSPEDLRGWKMNEAVHPDDLPEVIKAYTYSVATGAPYSVEHRCRRADGVYRWFQVRALAVHDAENKILGWYVLLTDIEDRKRAEDELKRSEARYRIVIETASDAVVSVDQNGAITLANAATKRMFGYNPEELIGKSLTVLMPGDMRERYTSSFKRFLDSGERRLNWQGAEVTALRADGVEFPAEVSFAQMTADHQKQFTGFIRDISEKKRSQEAILASERDLGLIINTVPVAAWSARPEGDVDFFNQRWLDYTGLTLAEAHGRGWVRALHPDDIRRVNDFWQRHILGGEPGEIEARIRRADGSYRWFIIRGEPLRDESGATIKWYGINIDIHDRKLAEERVQRSEAFLAEAQNLTRVGSFSWRVAAGELKWSEQLYRIFEYDPGRAVTLDLIGRRFYPEDLYVLDDMIRSARRALTDMEYEHRLLMPDGSVKYLHLVAHASRDHENQLEYVGAVQDVTERRLAESALAKARSELAQVAEITRQGVLTASIAHEVNQPLSGIILNAGTCLRMLNSEPPNLDGARLAVRRAIRDGDRASGVIAKLRALFGKGKKEVTAEPVDLNEATREVIALSSIDLQRHKVILQLELAERLPILIGDRVQLQQVVLNLMRNASEAMSGIQNRPRRLLIRTEQQDEEIRLTVQDSGVGLSPGDTDRIFESFYSTKADGMGVGLSISRSIIEAHRGRLWASANAGPGATFAFAIPCGDSG